MTNLGLGMSFLVLALALTVGAAHAEDTETLREGSWKKKTYEVKGSFRIVEEDGARYVELSADFRTKRGPDLKVFLSPRSLGEVNGANATRKSLRVGALPRHKGKQRIAIPAGARLEDYKSILIHCEQYSVLFAASALSQ